jgi:hypothetical protein
MEGLLMRPREMEFSGSVKVQAMRRADGRCEKCGEKSNRVEIHHKLGVYYAVNFYPMLPSFIISSIDNALVACPDCHRELDDSMAINHVNMAYSLLQLLGQEVE